MTAYLNITYRGRQVDAVPLAFDERHENDIYYSINLEDLLTLSEPHEVETRRRQHNRRFINRIADPEHGFPILRQLIETFGPILIQYLITNLPIWLADLADLKEEDSTA